MDIQRKNLGIVFLITLIFYAYHARPADWNIASRLDLVKAIVEEKRLEIDSYHEGKYVTGDKAYVNGHYYSDKAIGASLIGVLAYAPIHALIYQPLNPDLFILLITFLAISLPCAFLAPMIYSLALRFSKDKWGALMITLCVVLATPIFPFASAFYGHALTAVFAFVIFSLWMEVNLFGAQLTPYRAILSGFLLGFMVLTEYTTLIIAIILIGYILHVILTKHTSGTWQPILWSTVGGIIPMIIFFTYNWLCFGSPFTIGYANESSQVFQAVQNQGLMGIGWPNFEAVLYMTVHPTQGMFIQSPVLLLAIGGGVVMSKIQNLKAEFIVITAVVLIYLLIISGYSIWWGGDSFTARHLIPIFPFLGMLLIFLPPKYYRLLVGLCFISFLNMFIADATRYRHFDQYIQEILGQGFLQSFLSWKSFLIYRALVPELVQNKFNFSWGRYFFGIKDWYVNLAIPLTAGLILLSAFYFLNRKDKTASISTAKIFH